MWTILVLLFSIAVWLNVKTYYKAKKLGDSNRFEFIPSKRRVWDEHRDWRIFFNILFTFVIVFILIYVAVMFLP